VCQDTRGVDQLLADRVSRYGWGGASSLIVTPLNRSYQLIQLGSSSEAGSVEIRPRDRGVDRAVIVTADRPYQGLIEGPIEVRPLYAKRIGDPLLPNWGHWLEIELWAAAPNVIARRRAPLEYTSYQTGLDTGVTLQTVALTDHRGRSRSFIWAGGRRRQRLDIDVASLAGGDTVDWTLLGAINNQAKTTMGLQIVATGTISSVGLYTYHLDAQYDGYTLQIGSNPAGVGPDVGANLEIYDD